MKFPEEGIYFLFDPTNWKKRPWKKNIREILPYICALQLRCSGLNDREFFNTAIELKKMLSTYSIPLIINNRMDIARAAGADGVHLGKSDISLPVAKKCFNGIVGSSRHTAGTAKTAVEEGADYIGCGPVFKTATKKTGRKTIGTAGFLKIRKVVKIPAIPIGGINKDNIGRLKSITKIVAISSAINLSANPVTAVRHLYKSLNLAKI
ncbi:thiamine phosphate synthase [Elusimicrobiota bacterium]